jgi:hypothetical protein
VTNAWLASRSGGVAAGSEPARVAVGRDYDIPRLRRHYQSLDAAADSAVQAGKPVISEAVAADSISSAMTSGISG